jgi:arylsulfatase A-like enzyme
MRRPSRRAFLTAGAGLAAGALLPWGTSCSGGDDGLNVVLISIDTLRPDRMGVYGHQPMGTSTTPFLDRFTAEGARFTGAFSTSSWTLPAHWAMLSGVADDLHGVIDDNAPVPGSDVPLAAELFRGAGYATAGFYSGPYLHKCFGFDRGFDRYESCLGFETLFDVVSTADGCALSREELGVEAARTERRAHEAITSDTVTRGAVDFLQKRAAAGDGRPFFIFLHYFDVHNDFIPPPPLDRSFGPPYDGWVDGRGVMTDPRYHAGMDPRDLAHLTALYDGEIAHVDRSLDRLFRSFEKLDPALLERTVVVVTSDHGEEFFEHGRLGHRHNLHESTVAIPLIIRCPGRVPAGATISGGASVCDILPTLLDLTGIETPGIVTGTSLLAALKRGSVPRRPALLELTETPRRGMLDGVPGTGNRFRKHLALRVGALKLITVQERRWSRERPFDFRGKVLNQNHALYDLATDPRERTNLLPARGDLFRKMAARRTEVLRTLREKYTTYRTGGGTRKPIPHDVRKALGETGYL